MAYEGASLDRHPQRKLSRAYFEGPLTLLTDCEWPTKTDTHHDLYLAVQGAQPVREGLAWVSRIPVLWSRGGLLDCTLDFQSSLSARWKCEETKTSSYEVTAK